MVKKLEIFILVLLLTVTTANANKRARYTNEWFKFHGEALEDLEKRRFEEAKREFALAEQYYDEDDTEVERVDTTFARAVVDFYLKDYKSCETRLAQVANLESTFTSHPEHPFSNPLELLGDLRRAEGKNEAAREQYKSALEAKKYQKVFSPRQEQRLLHKLADIQSELDIPPYEYLREYTSGLWSYPRKLDYDD